MFKSIEGATTIPFPFNLYFITFTDISSPVCPTIFWQLHLEQNDLKAQQDVKKIYFFWDGIVFTPRAAVLGAP